jgi:hypothetical protein
MAKTDYGSRSKQCRSETRVLRSASQIWSKNSRLGRLGKKVALYGCVYSTFTHYVVDIWQLSERSMEPTLEDGKDPFMFLLLKFLLLHSRDC